MDLASIGLLAHTPRPAHKYPFNLAVIVQLLSHVQLCRPLGL